MREMKNVYFASLPDEIVSLIFSHIDGPDPSEIGHKIRLERVCKRFTRILKDGQAWNRNNALLLTDFQTRESLATFLDRVPEITNLTVTRPPFDRRLASELFVHVKKLHVANFTYNGVPSDEDCYKNADLVSYLMGLFRSTLKNLNFSACEDSFNSDCPLCDDFVPLIRLCPYLETVQLSNMVPIYLFATFSHKPLRRLVLDEGVNGIDGVELAQMANSVPNNSLTELVLARKKQKFDKRYTFGRLPEFLENLQPAAANAITIFEFQVKGIYFHIVPTVPTLMPNLKYIKLCLVAKGGLMALQAAEVIGEFMHSNSERNLAVVMDLAVTLNNNDPREHKDKFGENLWRFVNLLNLCKGGTRRTDNLTRWRRNLEQGSAKVNLCYPDW